MIPLTEQHVIKYTKQPEGQEKKSGQRVSQSCLETLLGLLLCSAAE